MNFFPFVPCNAGIRLLRSVSRGCCHNGSCVRLQAAPQAAVWQHLVRATSGKPLMSAGDPEVSRGPSRGRSDQYRLR
jgi:hypothetical protein